MASTNYGIYGAHQHSMEKVNWILAALVLLLLSFFMSTGKGGKDADQTTPGMGHSLKTFAYGLPKISQEPNGANYRLMSDHH